MRNFYRQKKKPSSEGGRLRATGLPKGPEETSPLEIQVSVGEHGLAPDGRTPYNHSNWSLRDTRSPKATCSPVRASLRPARPGPPVFPHTEVLAREAVARELCALSTSDELVPQPRLGPHRRARAGLGASARRGRIRSLSQRQVCKNGLASRSAFDGRDPVDHACRHERPPGVGLMAPRHRRVHPPQRSASPGVLPRKRTRWRTVEATGGLNTHRHESAGPRHRWSRHGRLSMAGLSWNREPAGPGSGPG